MRSTRTAAQVQLGAEHDARFAQVILFCDRRSSIPVFDDDAAVLAITGRGDDLPWALIGAVPWQLSALPFPTIAKPTAEHTTDDATRR